LHRGIEGAHCVMHTHTTAGCAVAGSQAGLSMDNFYSAQLHGMVAYHDFEGITVHADEGPRLLRSVGSKPAVILRNHGLVSWGATIPAAFSVLWTLQRACEIQVAGAALGPTVPISEAVQRQCRADALQFSPQHGAGRDVFDALVRQVQRVDPGYAS
jgi:ribulose-5-phosphate 4-epimerase/fuculose-1-phosphate aldolase